jgi:hypothetical protein
MSDLTSPQGLRCLLTTVGANRREIHATIHMLEEACDG